MCLTLALLFLFAENASAASAGNVDGSTGVLEKMVVARGSVVINLDANRLKGAELESIPQTLQFEIDPNSFFAIQVFNQVLRGAEAGSMGLTSGDSAILRRLFPFSGPLVIEKIHPAEPFDLVVRDGPTGAILFNVEGHRYEFDAGARLLKINHGRLLISEALANKIGRPGDRGASVGEISVAAAIYPIEVTNVVNGAVQSSSLPPRSGGAPNVPNLVPGPDVIVGDLPSLEQFGADGNEVGLAVGSTACNNGDAQVNWFQLPNTDHPLIPQNLYRMSGGATNDQRFEQIGQSWLKHAYGASQQNQCGFGCIPAGTNTRLGVGCSDPYTASNNAAQIDLGSRAWANPFTGFFPSNASTHTGHTHPATSHRLVVDVNDLTAAMNPGATYFAEAQYITPHEYTWCQTHPGQCNMYNNVSYRRFAVIGTGSPFSFSPVGATVRTAPALEAWTGANIQGIEPVPGVDGRAFVAYKVTQLSSTRWHYEYAVYNQNLDRGIQFFSVPGGCGDGMAVNFGFHAPLNPPGVADDGTVGNAGYSNVPWTGQVVGSTASWSTQTFAQNPNANAVRWGTLYNFRFDGGPPATGAATIGFFKTGAPVSIQVQGPAPECAPTPSPTPSPTPAPTATPTPSPTATATITPTATPTPAPTATASPTPTPSPTPAQALNISTRMLVESGNNVLIGGFIVSGNAPKTVALRGIGTSLTYFPFPGPLADPTIELRASNGLLISRNDNWQDDPSQAALLTGLALAPAHPKEAGLVATLQPGAYTAVLAGKNQEPGVGLVEIYDTNSAADSQLANMSTRGFVRTGDNVMIGGFILGGNSTSRVALRGIGPSLAQFGLNPALADPILELHDGNGTTLVANDDWQSDPVSAAQLGAAGFALSDPKESGIFISLPAGQFTAILAGKNGGIGIGLVELYNLR